MKFLFLLPFSLCLTVVHAQQTPDIQLLSAENLANRSWQDNERSQEIDRQQLREHSLKAAQNQLSRVSELAENNTSTEDTLEQSVCLPINDISINGLHLLSQSQRTTIEQNTPRDCFTEEKLNRLINVISQLFLESGYINTALTQHREGEKLTWDINVSTIEELENQTTLNTTNLLPNAKGSPINIKHLDQALDQANRLKGRTVTTDVYPRKDNTVKLTFVEEKRENIYGSISLDNTGSNHTGRGQLRAHIVADNPLGIADQLSLYANSTLTDDSRYSRGATLFYSVPYGYWTFSGSAGVYGYNREAQLSNNTVELSGKTERFSARAERVFSRGSKHISSAYATINHTEVDNRLLGSRIEVQSPTITAISLGGNHTQIFERSVLSANLDIRKGNNDLSVNGVDSNFHTVRAGLQWQQFFPIGNQDFRLLHQFNAQYSDSDLPAAEEMAISGTHAVAGFRNTSVTGDSGFYLRETLSTNFALWRYQLQPYLSISMGRAWVKGAAIENAVGGTLGFSLPLDNWLVDFSIAKSKHFVHHGAHVTQPTQAYLQVKWTF